MIIKDYMSKNDLSPQQRRHAFIFELIALWIVNESWSVTRRGIISQVKDTICEIFPSTTDILTIVELEGYAHAELVGNSTEMDLWEAEGVDVDVIQDFGRLYSSAKSVPPSGDQSTIDSRMYVLASCLSDMSLIALGVSPVSYNLNTCTQREPDFYGTVIDDEGCFADIQDFEDPDNELPELHTLRTRVTELYRIYPAIRNDTIIKPRVAFTLGVWELARRNNDRAEELFFEALYSMSTMNTDTQHIAPLCTSLGLQTYMFYGNLLLRGSRYMYASACYEAAIMICRVQQRKEYFMIARHAAEAAHKNDDIDRCIAIYNELYIAYMDKGRTNEGVYVLMILLDIYKQIGDFGEAERAIRDAYTTLSIPPSSVNGGSVGGNGAPSSDSATVGGSQLSSSPMVPSQMSSAQQAAAGAQNAAAAVSSSSNNPRSQALLDLEIKFCELFLSSQLYERGFVLLSELWRRDIPQRSKRDSIAILAAGAFAERGLLREVMYFFSTLSKHEDMQQQQQSQQFQQSFGNETIGGPLFVSPNKLSADPGGLKLRMAQILIRAFHMSGNFLEGFEFLEMTIYSYETAGFPSIKTKADLYYTRATFLANIVKRGKSVGYPRKLQASPGFKRAFYNEVCFPYCSQECSLQTFYRETDVLQEAAASYMRAADLYQAVSDEISIVRCRLSIAKLLLNYMLTSKIEMDSTKESFAMGSDFGTNSNSSNSEDDDSECFMSGGTCALNKPLSFPYFKTKALDTEYRNRNGRFVISIEGLQEFIFNALESSLDNMCIIWYIESLLNVAELRIVQNEIEGSMSYWKEAKNM